MQVNEPAGPAAAVNGLSTDGTAYPVSGRAWKWRNALLVAILVLLGLGYFSIRFIAFEPFAIPSGSMYPTLIVGDYIFVSKYRYGYSRYSFPNGLTDFEGRLWAGPVARGDVVVFRKPDDDRVDYVMRVVGMPGERIQMHEGILHIDGTPVERKRIEDFEFENGLVAIRYIETLPGGKVHPILETMGDRSPSDSTPEYTVPEGHYFMLGDNRDNAADSRWLGPVPYDYLIGRVENVYYSGRFDRIFKKIE